MRKQIPQYSEKQIRREFAIVREVLFGLLGRECFLEKESARPLGDISEATLSETIATFLKTNQR